MIQFFGAVDRHKVTGKVTSQYPAWYFERQIDDLRESIERKERDIASGETPPDMLITLKQDLIQETERLKTIHESKPKLTDKEKDEVKKAYNSLAAAISPTMFTRDEMFKKLADPYEEFRRNTHPIIKVTKEVAELAEANEIPISKGMLTRDNAGRLMKIAGKYLGENTNIEYLRKDKRTARG